MVILVNLVGALVALDVLVAVVLVVRVNVPSLYELGDVLPLGEVPLALEVPVSYEVWRHLPVGGAPLGLQGEVCHAHGVNGHPVTVDEYAPVGRYRVTVGVVQPVVVVERSPVGWVGNSLLADEHARRVHESETRLPDVALESNTLRAHAEGKYPLRRLVGLGLDFNGESVLARRESLEGHAFVFSSRIGRTLREVLHG